MNGALKPLALIYRAVITGRNCLYDLGILPSFRAPLPVLCVGNLTVGGNAKSPVTGALARFLKEAGLKPVVLLRGYGGTEIGPKLVTTEDSVADVGDEACMHRNLLPDIPVVISKRRVLGAKFVVSENLGDVIVLDDGFQHRALQRDLNFLLFDDKSLLEAATGQLLPNGRLREPLEQALKRASAVVLIHRGERVEAPPWLPQDFPCFHLTLRTSDLTDMITSEAIAVESIRSTPVALCSTIAKPEQFQKMMEEQGLTVVRTIFRNDHYIWTTSDVDEINKNPAEIIISTEKDRDKLKSLSGISKRIFIAGLKVELPNNFKQWLISKLQIK